MLLLSVLWLPLLNLISSLSSGLGVKKTFNRFGHVYHNLQPRVTRTLLHAFLDPKKALPQHYGAIQGLAALGPSVVCFIVKEFEGKNMIALRNFMLLDWFYSEKSYSLEIIWNKVGRKTMIFSWAKASAFSLILLFSSLSGLAILWSMYHDFRFVCSYYQIWSHICNFWGQKCNWMGRRMRSKGKKLGGFMGPYWWALICKSLVLFVPSFCL